MKPRRLDVADACVVCRRRRRNGLLFCATCGKAWDKFAAGEPGGAASSIEWVARRVWRFATTEGGK